MQRFSSNLYNFQLVAGVAKLVTPANQSRTYLAIFNNSANQVAVQFGRPANNPSDIILAGFDNLIFDDNVPIDAVGLYSIVGGNVVIMEGNPTP